jgi:hypothetical protein
VLGQRLDATQNKILEIAERMQGRDAIRLKVLAKTMRRIAIRWANIYHNERHQAAQKVKELEKELKDGQ